MSRREVAIALRKMFGLPVMVARFENLAAQEQMAAACGARVFVGVQIVKAGSSGWYSARPAHLLQHAEHRVLLFPVTKPKQTLNMRLRG